MPEAQDAVTNDTAPSEYAEHIDQAAAFLMAMLAEREKLANRIVTLIQKTTKEADFAALGVNQWAEQLLTLWEDAMTRAFPRLAAIDSRRWIGFLLDLHCTYTRDQLLVAMDFMKPAAVRDVPR